MKKWFIPVLMLAVTYSTVPTASQAWPWDKKPQQTNQQAPAGDAATDQKSDQTQQAQPAATTTSSADAPKQDTSALGPQVQVKSPLTEELNGLKVEDPVESPTMPLDKTFVAIDDPKNPLGITVSAQKLNDSAQLIGQKKYKEAEKILTPLKDWLVDATESHINLHKTLKSIPSAQVQGELEKQLALQFALLRDKAFFQLGMLYIGESDYPNAIKNLSRVIESQPRSPMGAEAYEVLEKIGFTEKIQLHEDKRVGEQPSQH